MAFAKGIMNKLMAIATQGNRFRIVLVFEQVLDKIFVPSGHDVMPRIFSKRYWSTAGTIRLKA
jgi:hypothetical protein